MVCLCKRKTFYEFMISKNELMYGKYFPIFMQQLCELGFCKTITTLVLNLLSRKQNAFQNISSPLDGKQQHQ